jgi:AcrR family transcriptional regulator
MGDQLEDRIIEATLRCVARWGIAKTTLDDVAREAGCGRATIYRTFSGGKGMVLRATLLHELQRCISTIDDAVRGADSLEEVLVAGVAAASGFISEHEPLRFLMAHEPDAVLPFVAFDKLSRVFDAAAACVAPHLARFLPDGEVPRAAEWVTRVVLTYTFNPAPSIDLTNEADARRLVRTYLLPALTPQTAAISRSMR